MKRSLVAMLTIAVLIGLLVPACGPAPAPTAEPQATAAEAQPTQPPAAEAVNIDFWYAMSGHNGEVIEELVKRFNESQSEVVVTATYQGSYDDAINKLKAGLQSKDVPAVVQVYDIGTRLLIDLNVITPMQDFIDAEGFDIADIEPNVANYYSVDGRLQSMPFNTSNPVLYYNKDLFKAAGLDPEKAPRTWDEVAERSPSRTLPARPPSGAAPLLCTAGSWSSSSPSRVATMSTMKTAAQIGQQKLPSTGRRVLLSSRGGRASSMKASAPTWVAAPPIPRRPSTRVWRR
jgi:ABC-type glycerol-3-phosphate transport system substrate-binding protein